MCGHKILNCIKYAHFAIPLKDKNAIPSASALATAVSIVTSQNAVAESEHLLCAHWENQEFEDSARLLTSLPWLQLGPPLGLEARQLAPTARRLGQAAGWAGMWEGLVPLGAAAWAISQRSSHRKADFSSSSHLPRISVLRDGKQKLPAQNPTPGNQRSLLPNSVGQSS